jgi:hypothetical protein
MDYQSLSLTELKQLAKNHVPKIKQYYIKSKAELIQILNLKEFPLEMKVAKMSMEQLRAEAKKRGHINYWKMRREQLVKMLYPNPQENDEDDDHAEEHDDPEESECE